MFFEICLAIITVSLVVLVIVLIRIASHVQRSVLQVQIDLSQVSVEVCRFSNSLNAFVRGDLHQVSQETGALVGKLRDLTSDIYDKSRSLNFLFKPFSFLTSKMGSDLPSSSKCEVIPQLLKWIATSIFLIKTTREVVKKL